MSTAKHNFAAPIAKSINYHALAQFVFGLDYEMEGLAGPSTFQQMGSGSGHSTVQRRHTYGVVRS